MVLSSITTGGVQEHDILLALPGLLVEDLALTPLRRGDVNVSPNDMIFIYLRLLVSRCLSHESIMKQFQNTTPDMRPVRESTLVSLDFNPLLFDIHAEHA